MSPCLKAVPLALLASCAWLSQVPQGRVAIERETFTAEIPAALVFEAGFPEAERELVEGAAAYWNAALGKPLFVMAPYALDFGTVVFLAAEERNPEDKGRPGHVEVAVTAFGYPVSGKLTNARVTFYSGWLYAETQAEMITTARHELAHVLGLDHSTDKRCILYPDILPTDYPRPACLAELNLLKELYAPADVTE